MMNRFFLVLTITMGIQATSFAQVEFVRIPGNASIPSFMMATTETTNEQYKEFLNAAYADGLVTYNMVTGIVADTDGNFLVNLNGSRVGMSHWLLNLGWSLAEG